MDTKLQLRVQRYGWDAAAPYYHDNWQDQLLSVQRDLIDISRLRAGQQVLETACGTGMVTDMLAEAVGEEGSVCATDISEKMLEQTTSRCSGSGFANVGTRRMGMEILDFPDARFDRAVCSLGLMYSPDPQAAISEMHRVLRSGGRASVLVWGERRNCGWAEIFPIVDAQVKSEVCPLFFSLGTAGALARAMKQAGFEGVEEHRIETQLNFASERELLNAFIDGGAVAMAAKRFCSATRQVVEQQFLDSVAQHRLGSRYRIPGEFVIAAAAA